MKLNSLQPSFRAGIFFALVIRVGIAYARGSRFRDIKIFDEC